MEIEKDERDLILEFIIKKPIGKNISSETLRKNLFKDLEIGQVVDIMFQIKELQPKIVSIIKDNPVFISGNDLTKPFLEKGGFTEIERVKKEKEEKDKLRELKKDQILDLSVIEVQFNIEKAKYDKKINNRIAVWGLIIAFGSFLISALTSGLFSFDDKKPQQNDQVVKQEHLQLLSKQKDSLIHSLNLKIERLHSVKLKNETLPKN